MKNIIQTLLAVTALATIGGCASKQKSACDGKTAASCHAKASSCSTCAQRKVVLDGKVVKVADCRYTPGLRAVRMVPAR